MTAAIAHAARFAQRRAHTASFARGFCAEAAKPGLPQRIVNMGKSLFTNKVMVPVPLALAGLYGANSCLQNSIGSDKDFFEGKFITTKDPDALAEFYQAEDLLKIIAIHPFFFDIVMDKTMPSTDEVTEETALLSLGETNFKTRFLGMDVSFEIIEQEIELEDGEKTLAGFTRHERFIDYVPFLADLGAKILLWDQTWNFGFKRLEDGTYEVFHHGESFYGPWPVRLIVMLHQRYVLWACERYINGEVFGTDDIDEQQEQMACIPLHEFRTFIGKLTAEKQRDIEAKERDPAFDEAAIAKERADLENLKALSEAPESTITVARRLPNLKSNKSSKPGTFAARQRDTLVAGDSKTQEALTTALKDARDNKLINDAMKDLHRNPSLKFSDRTISGKNRTLSRKRSRELISDAHVAPPDLYRNPSLKFPDRISSGKNRTLSRKGSRELISDAHVEPPVADLAGPSPAGPALA